jgi:nucleoside-diphosphate-sugar epimerase
MTEKQQSKANPAPFVLVTGGGGFLGKAIVRRLVARGDRVCSFSRSFYPELESIGAEQIRGDIGDKTAVAAACEGVGTVFHVAAKPGVWGRYETYYRTNVIGTRNIITACKTSGVKLLVYTSSPSVVFDETDMEGVDESVPYPEHYLTHYPKTKAIAEQEVVQAACNELHTIVLRPHLIWGPEDNHLVPRIIERAKKLRRVGDGNNRVDTIYIDNAAMAHIQAADKLKSNPELSGRIYFISQDEPIPLWDMVDAILQAAGLEPVKGSIPKGAAWLVGAVLELIYRILNLKGEPQMTRFVAKELATAHWFDISAAKRDLDYRPTVSTQEGLRRLSEWLQRNKANNH